MDSKKPLYKSKTFWVLALFLLYSTLGFFAVPSLLKKQLSKFATSDLNSQLVVTDVSFNPFTISADISGIQLIDNDSVIWFKADNIHVNVNLWASLFKHTSLSKVQLDNPYYLLFTEESEQSTQIKYPQISDADETTDETALLLNIDAIDIFKGSVDYNNKSSSRHLNLNIKEVSFNQQSFSTLDVDSLFSLSFTTENNDEAHINGSFNFVKSSINVSWKLNNWSTATVFKLIGDNDNAIQGIKSESGIITANGTTIYSGVSNSSPQINIDSFQLSNFTNQTESPSQAKINIAKLQITNADVNLDEQIINIESIDAGNTELLLSFDDDFNMIMPLANNIDNADSAAQGTDEKAWDFVIHSFSANQSKLNLNKINSNDSKINELNFNIIEIKNLTSKPQQTTEINLSMLVDSDGIIEANNSLTTSPLKLISNINFKQVNIQKWQDWMPTDINIGIAEGLLSLQQEFTFAENEFISQGWIRLNNLKLLDNNNQQFATINQLDLEQTSIDSKTSKISLNKITLDQAHGSLIISKDKQLNLTNITSTTNDTTNDKQTDDWIIEIKQVKLIDGKASVTDKSTSPSYQTELSKLNGSIKGLSSDNLSKADVDLNGVLDTYAKIKFTGQINPLSEKAYTDLAISVENLDLQNFSSYSGQLLGFPIVRGKADFELKYKLNQSLLEGINQLKFKQLKFGNKTSSKDAISLPLKLAVGLLTDGKGIMKINLPVRGNIDDPEFSYGGIVFKAFFKLITGIVASPFKLLGKLIPGGADLDLSGVQFIAGTIILNTGEDAKLQAMQKIIQKRPAIILELTGVVNSINDKKALQHIQLLSLLKLESVPSFDAEFPIKPIKTLYIDSFDQQQWSQLETKSSKDDVLDTMLLSENAWNELIAHQNVDELLNSLGKKRTAYIQQQLIDTYQLPQDKIFIKSSELTEEFYPQVKFGVGQ